MHLDALGQQRHELLAVDAAREGRCAPVHGGAARDAAARVDEDSKLPLPRARWWLHHEQLAVGQPREEGGAELGREGEELPHCTCARREGRRTCRQGTRVGCVQGACMPERTRSARGKGCKRVQGGVRVCEGV